VALNPSRITANQRQLQPQRLTGRRATTVSLPMNLKMHKSLIINGGILRFMGAMREKNGVFSPVEEGRGEGGL
jgi:hypothetical protein